MKKMTVIVTDETPIRLVAAEKATGLNGSDTVCRSISVYAALMVSNIGQPIEFRDDAGGPSLTVMVLDRSGMPDHG